MQTCSTPSADSPAGVFYLDVLTRLAADGVPFLIGGAFALSRYSSIHRDTKDLDVFVKPDDTPRALALMREAGYRAEMPFPHWLGKVYENERGGHFIDLPVTRRASDALCHVDTVIKIGIFRQVVNTLPLDGLIISKAGPHRLEIGAVRPDLAMTVHTRLCRRETRRRGGLDRYVTIPAIDAVIADVMLVAKLNRLLPFQKLSGQI